MTLMEFFGVTFLAFGPPFAMFLFTVANDPVRIIILMLAAFFWLISLLLSSLWWFMVVYLRDELIFGVVFSVLFQEVFRYLIYKVLRKADTGLRDITQDNLMLINNKHLMAYVSGLGFGIISGIFSLINICADALGPATMGLKLGTDMFFITSAATSLCFTLLHTFWNVIFFNALDTRNKFRVGAVVACHMLVSCLTLLNRYEIYSATLIPLYTIAVLTMLSAFKVAGGSCATFKACVRM